jgi:hypothetical protein
MEKFIKWTEVMVAGLCALICFAAAYPCFISGGTGFPDLTLDSDLPLGVVLALLGIALSWLTVRWSDVNLRFCRGSGRPRS